MKKHLIAVVAVLLALVQVAAAQVADALKVKEFTLQNGMKVWINEDHSRPTAYGAVVVKAGARDCPGTGIAHYFEHIMFKGTEEFGTVNYPAEKEYLDAIAEQYALLAQTSDESERTAIQMEINRLNIAASKYAIPNEFDVLTAVCGGHALNAFTSEDETVYHSAFIPAYFRQWAEINSARLINPVFRLFQGELETVYEEKNRMKDNAVSALMLEGLERFYAPSPYSESVIGRTESLKNPRLDQMAEFFRQYYIANNMGLLLIGDLHSEEILPIIEQTFGSIPAGPTVQREPIVLAEFNGREELEVTANIPLVKIEILCWRIPSPKEKEYRTAQIFVQMLSNAEGTGLLDKLTVSGELMAAEAFDGLSYNDAGALAVLVIPKIVGQKASDAEKLVLNAIGRIKEGDFEDSFLESVRSSYKKTSLTNLESHQNRFYTMASAMSQGKDWNEEMEGIQSVDGIGREEIMAFAKKYIGENCLVINKKTGTPANDNLSKPPYEKVVPENRDAESAYAAALKAEAAKVVLDIPEVDFENDVTVASAAPLVTVYAGRNPMDDVFELSFRYRVGTIEEPAAERLASYLNTLGTSSLSYGELRGKLQEIGGSVSFSAGSNSFIVNISGFDRSFDQTLSLAATMLSDAKGDKKKLSSLAQDEKAGLATSRKDLNSIATALYHYAAYGKESPELADKGKLTDDALFALYSRIRSTQCDIAYTGALTATEVAEKVAPYMGEVSEAAPTFAERTFRKCDGSAVWFIDKPDANQALIYAYIPTRKQDTREIRDMATLYDTYFGSNMTSVLFQEVREFRSLAYSCGSGLLRPCLLNRDSQGSAFAVVVGTQCDKTIEAVSLVDSLLNNLPLSAEKLNIKKIECVNELCHSYPDFRSLPGYVVLERRTGSVKDDKKAIAANIEAATEESLRSFSREYIEGRPVIWCVVGNAKKIDMKALAAFGPITKFKAKDVLK